MVDVAGAAQIAFRVSLYLLYGAFALFASRGIAESIAATQRAKATASATPNVTATA